jgi:hypothetical protein
MAQRIEVRRNNAARADALKVIDRILVARKPIEQVEIDHRELTRIEQTLNHPLAILRVAREQIDDPAVCRGGQFHVFGFAHRGNNWTLCAEDAQRRQVFWHF